MKKHLLLLLILLIAACTKDLDKEIGDGMIERRARITYMKDGKNFLQEYGYHHEDSIRIYEIWYGDTVFQSTYSYPYPNLDVAYIFDFGPAGLNLRDYIGMDTFLIYLGGQYVDTLLSVKDNPDSIKIFFHQMVKTIPAAKEEPIEFEVEL